MNKKNKRKIILIEFTTMFYNSPNEVICNKRVIGTPITGTFDFLVKLLIEYEVSIICNTSRLFNNNKVIRSWLREELTEWIRENNKEELINMDFWVTNIMSNIKFPLIKPKYIYYINRCDLSYTEHLTNIMISSFHKDIFNINTA